MKTFGRHIAVDDLSFTVHGGRITGFLGRNGAGYALVAQDATVPTTPYLVNHELTDDPEVRRLDFEGAVRWAGP